jgi:hypothetical protein
MSTGINNNNDDILEVEKELFKGAERTAERYGVNADRIMAVYKRYPDLGITSPSLNITQLDRLINQFDQAISVLGPSKAFKVFENEDVQKLADRVFLVNYLNHYNDILLCSLDQLARLIEEFISYLLNNRVDLIEDGYSRTCFLRSLFLDWQLAKLYHFNFPIATEAPSSEDRERLIAGRGKLFRLKIAVIQELLQAIRHQTPANLWEKCLPLLTEAISADDAEFYLRMDRLYMGHDAVHKGQPVEIPNLDRPGGLTDLLEVIGHCEEELILGAFVRTRKLLGELVAFDVLKRPILIFANYFEAAIHPLKDVLDSALDLFSSFEPKVSDFWENYVNRVNQALQAEFYVEPINGVKVKRKIMLSYELLRTFLLEPAKSHFEATGKFPWGPPPYSEESKPQKDFVFRRRRDFWEIIYEGQPCELLKHRDGLQYIAYLLAHPKDGVYVEDLYNIYKAKPLPNTGHTGIDEEGLAQGRFTISGPRDAGTKLTPKTRAQYRNRLKELQEEREKAESINDKGRLENINRETEGIAQQLKSGVGLRGRLRKDGDLVDKYRRAVANSITRALNEIEKENKKLWRHLYTHIKTGRFCSYTPEKTIPWEL